MIIPDIVININICLHENHYLMNIKNKIRYNKNI